MITNQLHDQLVRHEGLRLKPYRDTVGKLTIGVGRNLDDVGISEPEALQLLSNDIEKAQRELVQALPWTLQLDPVRFDCLTNMCFNLGVDGLLKFAVTLNLIKRAQFKEAAAHMLTLPWAHQVGERAVELSKQMEAGKYA